MNRTAALLSLCLLLLVVWSLTLAGLSQSFEFDKEVLDKPVLLFVLLQIAAGGVYLLTVWLLQHRPASMFWLTLVLLAGLVMRVSQFGSLPVLETDPYRYLWDGAVTAAGYNPYAISPHQVRYEPQTLPQPLQTLATQAGVIIERINHPTLRTIYPPITQGAFALAHWIKPFSMDGLRWTWLVLDFVIAGLLILLLRKLAAQTLLTGIGIYWLNPLLIKEVYNSGHMELVLVAAMLLVLFTAINQRTVLSLLMLGLAILAKVWPILWLPLLLRMPASSNRHRLVGVGLMLAMGALLLWPVLAGRLDGDSGFVAYTGRWQMNDSVHQLLYQFFIPWLPDQARLLARLIIITILLLLLTRCIFRFNTNNTSTWLLESTLTITTALFLLSPTQFPWYWLWLLPLLALVPLWSLLAFTLTLPVYYLYLPLHALGQTVWFDRGLVWLQFVPIWMLLFFELRNRRRQAHSARTLTPVNFNPSASLKVAVIIPTLNEEAAIAQVIDAIPNWVTQIIVADNGSTDRTPVIAQQHGAMVVHEPQRGYGAACLAGMSALQNPDVVVFLDGDFSDHPEEMGRLIVADCLRRCRPCHRLSCHWRS
ncbi:MAG: glycosyltransferase family 2 protein [Phycisphaerales bacterium]|nr:glycosyltransferase family 2 protein [Phycisphaerales bacterium]